jgi:hypothetical protein
MDYQGGVSREHEGGDTDLNIHGKPNKMNK